jgi:hypothetical protein
MMRNSEAIIKRYMTHIGREEKPSIPYNLTKVLELAKELEEYAYMITRRKLE